MTLLPPPSTLPPPPSDPGDLRLSHLLGRAVRAGAEPRASLVGFPVDTGVARNGGRVGSAQAPAAIRRALGRLCPDPDNERFLDLISHTRDLGDLIASPDLERDQAQLAEIVARELAADRFVIVLGGGHETSYGHFLGYVRAGLDVAIQNIDAHTDVRPLLAGLGHSGSPFRQALEHPSGKLLHYRVDGLSRSSVATAHLAFLRERGASFTFRENFNPGVLFAGQGCAVLATLCLDAVDQAFAPGVSAPCAFGLFPEEWLRAAYLAGACHEVRSFDLVELAPPYDTDGRSTRLAARTVFELLRGLASRG